MTAVTYQGEVSLSDRRRMVRRLRSFMSADEARDALARLSKNSRGLPLESIIAGAESEGTTQAPLVLDDDELIPLLVDVAGVDLLRDRELRWLIAYNAGPDRLRRLHEYPSAIRGKHTLKSRADAVARRKWHPGGAWPAFFVRTMRFPTVYAGWRGTVSQPDSIDVEPCVSLPALTDFQDELRARLMEVLDRSAGGNRAILTLPTGAGKTRTAVEALLTWRHKQPDRPIILWIAQSEELCEQAVQSFREVWFDLGHHNREVREAITIGRFWGHHDVSPTACDVVVASIQKLHTAVRGDSQTSMEELEALGAHTGAIVIDEAHRALAPSYGQVLQALGINFRLKHNRSALIGLTATPRRTSEAETVKLRRRFLNNVLYTPSLGADPVQMLRGQGILAYVDYETLDYDAEPIELSTNPTYAHYYEAFEDIHGDVLRRLGEERSRNRRLLERLLDLKQDWPVLLFACSTQHAQAMTSLLQRRGRTAACVLAGTRPATRRATIERFRAGEVSFLCNYGVLTTGFDAPSVRCVVVARPTASPILYEQMVGRGMRGPEFGGTDRCLVIDVQDNVQWRSRPVNVDFASLEADMRNPE